MNSNEHGEDLDHNDDEVAEVAKWESHIPKVFDRVIRDEVQKTKSDHTLAHRSVANPNARHINLLTATPMINRPLDLLGLLYLIWKEEWDTFDGSDGSQALDSMAGSQMDESDGDRERQSLRSKTTGEKHENSEGSKSSEEDEDGDDRHLCSPDRPA